MAEASQLYDVNAALDMLAVQRLRNDALTAAQVELSDQLATALTVHCTAETAENIGRVLVVAAASLGALAVENIPPGALVNVLAFAGQRIALDGRTAKEADRG